MGALVLCFPVGLWLGMFLRGKHVQFWVVAVSCGLAAAGGVYYFNANGPSWLAVAPIGAVAGVWTGMKYGYLDGLLGIFSGRARIPVESPASDEE